MISVANRYWAEHLGCTIDDMFTASIRLLVHGGELQGYNGVFALFRDGRTMISAPPEESGRIQNLLESSGPELSPSTFSTALGYVAFQIIGPAFIGYGGGLAPLHTVRLLTSRDASAIDALQASCSSEEWEHGGSLLENTCSGVFVDDRLVALSGYEIWGGVIAHLSIVTHPAFRGQGYGRSTVSHLAAHATAAGLMPQYRALESNLASIAIADSLGFQSYATSVAIRFSPSFA